MLNQTLAPSAVRYKLATIDWCTIAAFLLPFTLYLLTLAPTIYNLDSAELTTAAASGGITRATGYPLYLLLGRLWVHLPVGDVGYRMNLFSAVNGAITVALAERILRRMQIGPWAIACALGLLACSPFFWALSLVAEVYTFHTALMTALILLLLRWSERPTQGRLTAIGAVAGLGLCHHITAILFLPGCLWYVATVAPRRAFAPRALFSALGAFVLALCLYLYLPLLYTTRPVFNYAGHYDAAGTFVPVDLLTPDGLWWLVSGRAFDSLLFKYTLPEVWAQTLRFGVSMSHAFFAVGVGPGILGIIILFRRNWRLGGTIALMFLANAIFFINYRVVDKETMYLPMFMIWSIWLAVGYQWLLDWLQTSADDAARPWGLWALRGVMISVVVVALSWNWQLTNLSHDRSTRELGEAALHNAGQNALILGWWNTVPSMQYLQIIEGERRDVKLINRFLISRADMEALIDQDIKRRPIYIDSTDIALLQRYDAEPAGPLYRLIQHIKITRHARDE